MGLKGNLSEFNITNILQMVSAESKTGTLTVCHDKKLINIIFFEGRVAACEKTVEEDEMRLEGILTTNNYISKNDWSKAYAERKKTLKPFFTILKKYVLLDNIKDIYNTQIKDYIFSLLRWEIGEYEFTSQKVDFDNEIVTPLDIEFLLMEGCRILDEWREIDKNLAKIKKYIKKNIFDEKKLFVDTNKENTLNLEIEVLKKRGITLDEKEKNILLLLDTFHTIEEIVRVSKFDEFETCRIIDDFLTKNIIISYKKKRLTPKGEIKGEIKKSQNYFDSFSLAALLFLILGINILYGVHRYNNFSTTVTPHVNSFLKIESEKETNEIKILEAGIFYYYLLKGYYPESLDKIKNMNTVYFFTPQTDLYTKYNYSLDKKGTSFFLSKKGNTIGPKK